MQVQHPLSLEELYHGLSDAIAGIVDHPDAPDGVKSCMVDFACNLRSSLRPEQQKRIDAHEMRQVLPMCLTLLSDNDGI